MSTLTMRLHTSLSIFTKRIFETELVYFSLRKQKNTTTNTENFAAKEVYCSIATLICYSETE